MIRVPAADNEVYIPALKKAKVLGITGFANLLELYDFTLFAVLLPILVGQFFPSGDHKTSMLIGYLAFAVSFLIAPIGSIIWGYIGDRFGSGKIFRLSLLLMAFPSLAISVLPTYEEAGYIAPILLITLRIFQGFSASGEVLASKIYAFDKVGKSNFLQASAFISACGGVGVLLAMSGGAYVSANPEAWRLLFAIGGGMILITMLVRILIDRDASPHKQPTISLLSVLKVVQENRKGAIGGFTASAMLGVLSYFMHGFLVNFQVTHLGYDLGFAYQAAKVGLLGTIIAAISCAGLKYVVIPDLILKYCHCEQMRSNLMRLPRRLMPSRNDSFLNMVLTIAVLSTPLYLLLLLKIKLITYISLFLMGGLLGVLAALSGVYVITSFAHSQRCRGALLVNAFGVAIFGGITPLLMTMLAGISIALPGIALGLAFIVGYLIIIRR